MHADKLQKSIIALLVVMILTLIYYIGVNTFFRDRVFPNVRVESYNVDLYTPKELNNIYYSEIENLPDTITVSISNVAFRVPTEKLKLQPDYTQVLDYGKGSNIVKVLSDGLTSIAPKTFDIEYSIDTDRLISYSPYTFNSPNGAKIINQELTNCIDNEFSFDINKEYLNYEVTESIKNKKFDITLDANRLVSDTNNAKLFYYCEFYKSKLEQIRTELTSKLSDNTISAQNLFGLYEIPEEGLVWKIKDRNQLAEKLTQLKSKIDILPTADRVEYVDNTVIILEKGNHGKVLDLDETVTSIDSWLANINSDLNIEFDTINNGSNYVRSLDFTQKIAEGKTRLDIIRAGSYNWALTNAQAGVEELHNTIIYPGEEFSYINHVKPRDGNFLVMESGRPLGGGTCNSTTTLFRAVLEAGLPITERQSHTFYVNSYAWGPYPLNIVDATYYYQPNVDLKFVNDLNYPILLRSVIYKKNDGYQYHTVEVYSDSRVKDRKVELTNWRKFNETSETRFSGSFDRRVYDENNKLIIEDTFTSRFGAPVTY